MTNTNLLNNAIDILLHNGISSIDKLYIQKYKDELLSDDIPDDERKLFGDIKKDASGIRYIWMYSKTQQGYWNIRALWVRSDVRRQKIATGLLNKIRRQTRVSNGITVFIPFNEQRFALSKLMLGNGYRHNRYIASISATEYSSTW